MQIKREIAEKYNQFFKGTDMEFIREPDHARSNYWLNGIYLRTKEEKNSFLKYSNDNGIITRPTWELLNRLPIFSDAHCGDLTNAEWISDRLVNLPSSVIH